MDYKEKTRRQNEKKFGIKVESSSRTLKVPLEIKRGARTDLRTKSSRIESSPSHRSLTTSIYHTTRYTQGREGSVFISPLSLRSSIAWRLAFPPPSLLAHASIFLHYSIAQSVRTGFSNFASHLVLSPSTFHIQARFSSLSILENFSGKRMAWFGSVRFA